MLNSLLAAYNIMKFQFTQIFAAAAVVFGLVAAAPVAEIEARGGNPSCGQRRAVGGPIVVDCI